MEEKSLRDLQDEIIVKLKELNLIIEGLVRKKQNEEKFSHTFRN